MADPDAPPLTREQVQRLVLALRSWAERHPAPDDPVLSFAGSKVLSPKQLAVEVASNTPDGEVFLRVVRFGLEVMPFEEIISRFERVGREHP
jgi:hypothetical protein